MSKSKVLSPTHPFFLFQVLAFAFGLIGWWCVTNVHYPERWMVNLIMFMSTGLVLAGSTYAGLNLFKMLPFAIPRAAIVLVWCFFAAVALAEVITFFENPDYVWFTLSPGDHNPVATTVGALIIIGGMLTAVLGQKWLEKF
jgi:hypothetical protein